MSERIYLISLGVVCIFFSAFMISLSKRDFSFIKIRRDRNNSIILLVFGCVGMLGGAFVCSIPFLFF